MFSQEGLALLLYNDRDSENVTDYSRSCPGLDSVKDEQINETRIVVEELKKKIHKRMNTVLSNYFVLHNKY